MTILDMRRKLNWSQSKFAKYFDIPVHTLQNWEQGLRNPPDYVVKLIKRVLVADGYFADVES